MTMMTTQGWHSGGNLVSEALMQKAFIDWCRIHPDPRVRMTFHINNNCACINEAGSPNEAVARGLIPGAADLFIPLNPGLFLELKYNGNRQSEKQVRFQDAIEGVGYNYVVANSFDEAVEIVIDYLTE